MPKCINPGCDNETQMGKRGKWKIHCSTQCRGQHNSIVGAIKRKNTCLEKFGATTNLTTVQNKEKSKNTLLEKYGVEHHMHCQQVKDKIKLTCIDRYGVDNPSQSEEIKQKKINTYQINFGVDHPSQSEEIKQKKINTCQDRYGVDHYSKTDEYKEKFQATSIKRYNVSNPSKTEWVKDKISAIWARNYKRNIHPSQKHISDDTLNKLNDVQWLTDNQHQSSIYLAQQLGITYYTVLAAYKKHNISRTISASTGEEEIYEFISQHYDGNIIRNTREVVTPKEIDIFIPKLNLAFEFDGIFWHSELNGKDRNYHLNKTRECQRQGIRLIHIYENEWTHKTDIVKSRILNLLNLSKKIYARKCKIVSVSSARAAEFLESNHIQGSTTSSIRYGLEYDNQLVAVMTFSKSRYNKSIEWELVRYTNKTGCSVVGGASRLFRYFTKIMNPKSIISYSDNRWNTGVLYNNLGFEPVKKAPKPSYKYTKNYSVLEDRVQYQKHKLAKLLPDFNPDFSEWENMKNNGYDRIWDCGNSVFIWTAVS